jgi:polysaccharide deacetylase family protein (PEP-CTERM system associated)
VTMSPPPRRSVVNALTIDVEDYFQVSAFAPYIRRDEWATRECRVERNVHLILDMLDRHDTRATFFTLGWLSERYPALIHEIAQRGHEVASHGHGHERVSDLTPESFRQDLMRAKASLEDAAGQAVLGYRAPSFSIGQDNLWALDVLLQTGHRYSSSIYPIAHDHYGMPDAPRFAYAARQGLIEVPPTTLHLAGRNLPSSGGGFFRLFPYALSRWMIRQVNEREGQSAVFYFHPWEVDPEQPRVAGADAKSKFRHYLNLARMQPRLERLLADFRWGRMDQIFLPTSESKVQHA